MRLRADALEMRPGGYFPRWEEACQPALSSRPPRLGYPLTGPKA